MISSPAHSLRDRCHGLSAALSFACIAFLALPAARVSAQAIYPTDRAEILAGGRHYLSLLIVLSAPLLDTLIHAIVRHFTPPMRGAFWTPFPERQNRESPRRAMAPQTVAASRRQ